jgi:hypothetical protein
MYGDYFSELIRYKNKSPGCIFQAFISMLYECVGLLYEMFRQNWFVILDEMKDALCEQIYIYPDIAKNAEQKLKRYAQLRF